MSERCLDRARRGKRYLQTGNSADADAGRQRFACGWMICGLAWVEGRARAGLDWASSRAGSTLHVMKCRLGCLSVLRTSDADMGVPSSSGPCECGCRPVGRLVVNGSRGYHVCRAAG
ncbi:hypothetical protein BDZ97DRAFT_1918983 [Flammula alnicola]|nr:hypothetical protein BDZ97DRAFT_1918983 [Flammula alnicola]